MLSDYEMFWAEMGMNEQDMAEAMGEIMGEIMAEDEEEETNHEE